MKRFEFEIKFVKNNVILDFREVNRKIMKLEKKMHLQGKFNMLYENTFFSVLNEVFFKTKF